MTGPDGGMKWFEKFIDNLAKLLKEPPYHLFLFIGSVFVLTTLIFQKNFEQTWTFFLYSIGGIMWRYAEKDIIGPLSEYLTPKKLCVEKDTVEPPRKYQKSDFWIRSIYHIGNFGLFFALLHYLKFF